MDVLKTKLMREGERAVACHHRATRLSRAGRPEMALHWRRRAKAHWEAARGFARALSILARVAGAAEGVGP